MGLILEARSPPFSESVLGSLHALSSLLKTEMKPAEGGAARDAWSDRPDFNTLFR